LFSAGTMVFAGIAALQLNQREGERTSSLP
jgi:hypothetical protein